MYATYSSTPQLVPDYSTLNTVAFWVSICAGAVLVTVLLVESAKSKKDNDEEKG